MLERIIILSAFILIFYLGMLFFRKLQLKKIHAATGGHSKHTKNPMILYFWSPQCQHCKTTQKPILERLKAEKDAQLELQMININEQPDEAAHWGVRTVPTTYILNELGDIAHINNGLATEKQLLDQLDSLL